jgi:hypothetical protein
VTLAAGGWGRLRLTAPEPGRAVLTAEVAGRADLAARSNPIEVSAAVPEQLIAWGDAHAQSVIGCGVRSIERYFAHARDFAATDFCSHQANCFLVSAAEWEDTERGTAAAHADGRFVTLLGVEWSAASRLGGDHNLYFPGERAELRRCSHQFVADKSDAARDLPHVNDLHAHYAGTDTLVAVHVGGRTADLQYHEGTLDRLLEVHSTHATSEWFLFEALRRGQRFGVIAGSDGVDGRPGASHPGRMGVRNVRGGLTAVMLPALTRAELWRALRERRCYATTGERIVLATTLGRWNMGDEAALRIAPGEALPPMQVQVSGTAPLETVDFFRDDQLLARRDLLARAVGPASNRYRIGWRGAAAPGNWERARLNWDGELRIEGARIVQATPWAFDTPDEGLIAIGEQRVAWRSVTAGDWDGVELTLDNHSQALLTFSSAPLQASCALHTIPTEGWCLELEAPMRLLEVRRLPAQPHGPAADLAGGSELPTTVALEFIDTAPPPGAHAYWVRVRQVDGAYAWSTPIFLDINGEAK